MTENGKVKVIYSWPVIILALCCFWPVGIFLIVKRVSIDKKAAMSMGKLVSGLGIASYAIACLGIVACLSDGFASDDVTLILFFGIAGFVLRKVAKKIKNAAESVKQYLSIIVNGEVRQLDTIAAATGKDYGTVKGDIQKMIQKGYLKNTYIDEGLREVVLPGRKAVAVQEIENMSYNQVAPAIERPVARASRTVACPCCGANNTITGATGECEYCGSTIE